MPQDADWSAFLADVELTELKLAGVFGQVRELVDSDEGDLPAEWKVEVSRAHLVDESQIRIRVIAEAEGPGGRLVVDGLGVFAARSSLRSWRGSWPRPAWPLSSQLCVPHSKT